MCGLGLSATGIVLALAVGCSVDGWEAKRATAGDERLEAVLTLAAAKGYDVTEVCPTSGCVRISYVLRPTDESYIRCQLALPVAKSWSGRLWGFGNGGAAGRVNVPLSAAVAGDVAVHTDMGTSRGAFGKREVIRDFGWRATHLMTVSAKEMTKAFFGRPPAKCYFRGVSTGGGQGFHEVLRFPEDYDGVLSYVPANTRLPLHVYFAWNYRMLKDSEGRDVFTQDELAAVEQSAIDWQADKDEPSARGKYMTDTRYSPNAEKAILELAVAKMPSLKDGDKLVRLHKMFEGPVLEGRRIHAGVPFSASLSAAARNQWMLEWYFGPGRTPQTVSDRDLLRWMEDWGPDCNACGEGAERFFARGGKMIVVGGLEDSVVPYPSMVDWFDRTAAACGRRSMEASCRLYLLPGRAHGQGGRGCGDLIGDRNLLVKWVERGEAPFEVKSPLRGGGTLSVRPYEEKEK